MTADEALRILRLKNTDPTGIEAFKRLYRGRVYRLAHALGCTRLDGLGCSCGVEPQEQR